jgi:hypothetical protein
MDYFAMVQHSASKDKTMAHFVKRRGRVGAATWAWLRAH